MELANYQCNCFNSFECIQLFDIYSRRNLFELLNLAQQLLFRHSVISWMFKIKRLYRRLCFVYQIIKQHCLIFYIRGINHEQENCFLVLWIFAFFKRIFYCQLMFIDAIKKSQDSHSAFNFTATSFVLCFNNIINFYHIEIQFVFIVRIKLYFLFLCHWIKFAIIKFITNNLKGATIRWKHSPNLKFLHRKLACQLCVHYVQISHIFLCYNSACINCQCIAFKLIRYIRHVEINWMENLLWYFKTAQQLLCKNTSQNLNIFEKFCAFIFRDYNTITDLSYK